MVGRSIVVAPQNINVGSRFMGKRNESTRFSVSLKSEHSRMESQVVGGQSKVSRQNSLYGDFETRSQY